MKTYIGTIQIRPPITVYLDEGMIRIQTDKLVVELIPDAAMLFIVGLMGCRDSGKTRVYAHGSIEIPCDRAKAAINILLKGLNSLGRDTFKIQAELDVREHRRWEEGRGVYPDRAKPIEEDY